MILGSNYSFRGKAHKVTNTVCQDASIVKVIVGDWTVMATADGVGSCPKSDIGSKTAVETASELCVNAFPIDGNDEAILALLRTAFNSAMRAISQKAKEAGEDIALYDTTLDVVIFNGSSKLYYGHCGDGGIFILNGDGDYKEITTVQEGEEASSVIPLRSGNGSWEFGIYEDEIAVVASFTDGIRDKLSSPLLRNEPCTIDVPLANLFMFVDVYDMSESETLEMLKQSMQASAKYLRSPDCNITDDVTMGILVNTSVLVREDPIDRYVKPNWAKIWHDTIERLYPNPDAVNQVFRRHKLEEYITKNPDKCDATGEQLEQLLDTYYPLTPEQAEQFREKYHPTKPDDDTPQNEKDTQQEPKSDDGEKPHSGLEGLLEGIKNSLKSKKQPKVAHAVQEDLTSEENSASVTEKEIPPVPLSRTPEELDVPIVENAVIPNPEEQKLTENATEPEPTEDANEPELTNPEKHEDSE